MKNQQTAETQSTTEITKQLRRIRGQVEGIERMLENQRACIDVVRQIIAIRNSLSTVARNVLEDEAQICKKEQRIDDLNDILKEVFKYH